MITTGVMFGLGDLLAQRLFPPTKDFDALAVASPKPIVATASQILPVPDTLSLVTSSFSSFINSPSEPAQSFDHLRSMRAVIYGSLFFAPIVVVWQGRLLPRVMNPFIRTTTRRTMNPRKLLYIDTGFRVLVDQLIMPGFIFIPLYNTVMITLAMPENPIEKIKEKLRNGWWCGHHFIL
jgi:protein Mpv17